VTFVVLSLGQWLAPAESAYAASRGGSKLTYKVKKNDQLGKIAVRYQVTVRAIQRLNRLKSDRIIIGQTLRLPRNAVEPASVNSPYRKRIIRYTVKPNDILGEIAKRYGTTLKEIMALNRRLKNANSLRMGMKLRIRTTGLKEELCPRIYVVEAGDSLLAIMKTFKLTKMDILHYNPKIKNLNHIRIGRRIRFEKKCPPAVSKSESVGKASFGRLVNGVKLSCGKRYPWHCRTPRRSWGTRETINGVKNAIYKVYSKYPKAHKLVIEHISAKEGGHLRPHVSHQSGRDVDMGLYFANQPAVGPKRFLDATRKRLDYEKTWALLIALIGAKRGQGVVKYIFLDYAAQERIYRWAKRKKEKPELLSRMFQYPRGKRALRGIIRHVKGHKGHLHVRFKCPKGDKECRG
jgi:LysM repeat protein